MKSKGKKKIDIVNLILFGILIAGLILIAYPSFADWWNRYHSYHEIQSYTARLEDMDGSEFVRMREEAYEYNRNLGDKGPTYALTDDEMQVYKGILDINENGMMGYIYIPKIRVTLPVYHTTDDTVLQRGIGHMPGTSLPVGGEGTHCVITGHRGLPSARLFSDIDQLREGDVFMIQVLDDTLTYEVDQIHTVLPTEMKDLKVEEGKDYCTLVTCTPYGGNTHRPLVRGHRVETTEAIHVSADAVQMDQIYAAFVIGAVILLVLLIIMFVQQAARRKKRSQQHQ